MTTFPEAELINVMDKVFASKNETWGNIVIIIIASLKLAFPSSLQTT